MLAQFNLGRLYESGRGVPQSDTMAARLYKQAADQGHAQAQYSLGHLYESGRGVPQSDAEAARLYKLAADRETSVAEIKIGHIPEIELTSQHSEAPSTTEFIIETIHASVVTEERRSIDTPVAERALPGAPRVSGFEHDLDLLISRRVISRSTRLTLIPLLVSLVEAGRTGRIEETLIELTARRRQSASSPATNKLSSATRPRWESRDGDDVHLTPEAFVEKYYAVEKAAVTPRPPWNKNGPYGEKPAEFIAIAYKPEMAAGTLHRGLIGVEQPALRTKLNSWLRHHELPEGVDVPTQQQWLDQRRGQE